MKNFNIKFNHLISPDLLFSFVDSKVKVGGYVYIKIDSMLEELSKSLGLKILFDNLIKREITNNGYKLNIKGISSAFITIENNNLKVKANYLPGREWWVKPIALIVLNKILYSFSQKIKNCQVSPGFDKAVDNSMKQFRKKNSGTIDLKSLFENQTFSQNETNVLLNDFAFNNVETNYENGLLKIKLSGAANYKIV